VATIAAVRSLFAAGRLPPPVADERCRHCSLRDACLPTLMPDAKRVERVLAGLFIPAQPSREEI
ncbi:MAG: CRISPR-associated protein Cas4, partial [Candidatus Sericytochromatia bacterium]|nr:CRISPR-associated protein Cas4 [Candidatus Sericytochromatia bacterium]